MSRSAPEAHSKDALLSSLKAIGQQHLAAFWDQPDTSQRAQLAEQILSIDQDLFQQLQREHLQQAASGRDNQSHWADLASRAQSPPAMLLDGSGVSFSPAAAQAAGASVLQAGKVGMILVAGGLGTRLGFDPPKGMFPIGPVSGRTLFQVLLEQLQAVGRRYGVRIPLYIMTSPATDAPTRQFLDEHARFGLERADVHIFCQSTMWALDDRWERILLESPGSVFLGPDGHGGMLAALKKSGGLADAWERGLRYYFYGQIDNPLTQVCDELTLGAHLLAGSEMTTQVVRKRNPLDRVGNVVSIDGRVHVIEYSDLPDEFAKQTAADGSLKLWAGNLAVHIFNIDFLIREAGRPEALPFHCAQKKVACLNAQGSAVNPDRPNAIRFERFIFDLLPWARHALVVEVDPAEAFAPVKNSDDEPADNPQTARAAMIAQHRRWLEAAGVQVSDGVAVEINPLWAHGPDEVACRGLQGKVVERPTYFS